MHIGVIGGGLMGLTVAYRLAATGHQITLLEQGTALGGLNGEILFEDGLRVPRYQHALLPTDKAVQMLCAELSLEDELHFQSARTGFIHQGHLYPLSNMLELLGFPMLSMWNRLRLGGMILRTRTTQDWHALDALPAKDWLIQTGGVDVFERIWKPLLEAKFDWVYDNVSATYIWAWLNRMTGFRQVPQLEANIGYLRRGPYALIQALGDALRARGAHILLETRVREIEVSNGHLQRLRTVDGVLEFDAVVVAQATPTFLQLIPGATTDYRDQLAKSKYLGLICPVLVLEQPLSEYWSLHLTDPNYPFATIIQLPYAEGSQQQVVYLPRYTAPDNDWMGVSDADIEEAWLSHLENLFPAFKRQQVRHFAVSRSRYVDPVHQVNGAEQQPAIQTPYAGLFLANTEQVYPELPTSEAVITHAGSVIEQILMGTSIALRS
jgi:protoporphyrinogen oxidase